MLFRSRSAGVSWLVVCLGNPGPEYEATRHNAGVDSLTRLAASYQKHLVRRPFSNYRSCLVTPADGHPVRLVFPLTFMNSSGEAAKRVVKEGDEVLVICDQMDLPVGRMRLRRSGSSAGHNGLKSMMAALPNGFARLYIGVGRPAEGVSVIDHVLTHFSDEEARLLSAVEDEAACCLRLLLDGMPFEQVAQRANSFHAS